MKLNLGCGADLRFHEYLNIDISSVPDAPAQVFRQGDVTDLDWLCEAGTVDEILALDVLPCFKHSQLAGVLANWASKIHVKGVLEVSFPDATSLTLACVNGLMDIGTFNQEMFREGEFKSAVSSGFYLRLLNHLGFEVLTQRLVGHVVFVRAGKVS